MRKAFFTPMGFFVGLLCTRIYEHGFTDIAILVFIVFVFFLFASLLPDDIGKK